MVRDPTLVLALSAVLKPAAIGQVERGTGTGLVTDNSEAVICRGQGDDSIYCTNVETHTTTTASGIYHLLSLPPGRYELRVEHDGFRPAAGDFSQATNSAGNRMVVYDPTTARADPANPQA